MTASPSLTAAVLTYNGRHLLEVILPSLAAQTHRDFHTVIVDNGSTDDTLSWLAAHWPGLEVVSLPENVGVAAALNVCVGAASGEFVVLLNNDLELDPDCLGELEDEMRRHPQAVAGAAKLLAFSDRTVLDGAGDVYTWGGEANRRGQGETDRHQFDAAREVFSACGAAAIYRRSAFAEVGLFDENLFAIYEDVDWCFRAQLVGRGCRYVPTAVAYHMGSATLGSGVSDFALYHNWRNAIWVVVKNYPAPALVRHAHRLLFVQLRNLGIALRRGRGRLWLRVWRDALSGLPTVLRQRSRVQSARVRPMAELDALIGAGR